MTRTNWKVWLACGLAGMLTGACAEMAAAQSAPIRATGTRAAQDDAGDFLIQLRSAVEGEETVESLPRSDYWIGIAIGELPDVAKVQLGLEHGLVVSDVMEGGPAAKIGFKAHDILIKAGDAKLAGAADLIKAVDAAKEKELAIVVVRDGKEQTIKVTPIKRPKTEAVGLGSDLLAPVASPDVRVEIRKLEEALNKLKEKTGDNPLGIVLARPGVVPPAVQMPYTLKMTKAPEFPKNLSISITKKGGEPAKIHVEQDGKEWNVIENKLDELPEGIRVHVQQFFVEPSMFRMRMPAAAGASGYVEGGYYVPRTGGTTGAPGAQTAPRATARAYSIPAPPTPVAPATPAQPPRTEAYRLQTAGGVERKLDTILKKLSELESRSVEQLQSEVKQLRKELDELRGKSKVERDE